VNTRRAPLTNRGGGGGACDGSHGGCGARCAPLSDSLSLVASCCRHWDWRMLY
jgi:hypothetical protein